MSRSTTTLETTHASRYLQQLCKHFAHKVPTQYTPAEGHVSLPWGECDLTASDGALTLQATAPQSTLLRLERFLADHLARFAFREPHTLVWTRSS